MLNLYRIETAGVISARTISGAGVTLCTFGLTDGSADTGDIRRIDFDEIGVAVGETVSVRARIAFDGSGESILLRAKIRNSDGAMSRVVDSSAVSTPTGFVDKTVTGIVRQSGEQTIALEVRVSGGTGDIEIDRGMVVRGPSIDDFRLPFRNERGLHLVRHQLETNWGMDAAIVAPRGSQSMVAQRSDWGGRLRSIEQGYPEVSTYVARLMRADIARLNKGMNAFNFMDTRRQMPSTDVVALGVVDGADQLGKTIDVVKSASVSPSIGDSELVARAGDLVSIDVDGHWQLFTLTEEARTNASGEVTLTLDHAVRFAPDNGALVRFSQAIVSMTTEATVEEVSTLLGRRGGSSIQFVEAI